MSTIFIYLFYGGKTYQLIKFEPENLLKQLDNEAGQLFLPVDFHSLRTYEPRSVSMTLYPHYEGVDSTQNTSVTLNVYCRNQGLMIESMVETDKLSFHNKEGLAKISLSDYYNGFNNSYVVDHYNPYTGKVVTYSLEQDKAIYYLLEKVTKDQKVIFSMEFGYYVLVFFQNDGLLQLYDIEEGIRKVEKDFDYNEKFGNCSIEYIRYSFIDTTSESFIIVN